MADYPPKTLGSLLGLTGQPPALPSLGSLMPSPPPQVPMPQVADADAMKASFERILDVMRKSGQGSPEWNARAPYVNDMSQKIYNLTGEVYSQGQWVKVAK